MLHLIIYSTEGCHLCELAETTAYTVLSSDNLHLEHVDIAHSEALMKQYGWLIPVIKDPNSDNEIAWPFDAAEFQHWLTQNRLIKSELC